MLIHKHSHTHMPAVGGGSELQTKSWHFFGSVVQVSSAHCFWINGSEMIYLGYLPPEHRHTHNTSFFPPSLFIQRHWRRETPTGGKKREKSGRAALSRPESHYLTNTKFTNVSFILQFRLLFCGLRLIHTHLFSDIMENMSELVLRIADSLTLASSATSTALSGEISTITR